MAGLTDISLGNFTTLEYEDRGAGDVLTEVYCIQSLTHPTDERNIVEAPCYGTIYPRKLVGSSTTGNCEAVVNFKPDDATHLYLLAAFTSGAQQTFRITVWEDATQVVGTYFEFNGRVASKSSAGEFDSVTTITFSIAIDGAIGDWTPIP